MSRTHAKPNALSQFEKWAPLYDRSLLNEIVFFPAMRACQEEIQRWKHDRATAGPYRLLDVGCGTGSLLATQAADRDAAQLVGIDYAPAMARQAAAKFAASPAAERLSAAVGDSERLPFCDGVFDVVACCHSFHHYPHQPAVVCEFHRVLRRGGVLILIDGFRDNVIGWVVFDVAVSLAERGVHHASWSATRQMLLSAGFTAVRQRKLNVLAPLLVSVAVRG